MEYIYIIVNSSFAGCFKVGKTTNFQQRMRSYNTGDPYRRYEYAYLAMVEDSQGVEDDVAAYLEDYMTIPGHEWYRSTKNGISAQKAFLKRIIKRIESYPGFIRSIINQSN